MTTAVLAANEPVSPIRDALHGQYRYTGAPPLLAKSDRTELISSDESVIRLDKMTIVESAAQRDLARDVQRHWEHEAEREFSWNKGGLIGTKIFGRMIADYGVWPHFFYGADERHLGRLGPANVGEMKIEFLRMRW